MYIRGDERSDRLRFDADLHAALRSLLDADIVRRTIRRAADRLDNGRFELW